MPPQKLLAVAVEAALNPTGRKCGDCALCCKLLPISELKKPRNEWCHHCAPKSSSPCKIYENRPQSCAAWMCLWLADKDFPESKRPNKSHVAWDTMADQFFQNDQAFDCIVAWVDPNYPWTVGEQWFLDLVDEYAFKYNLPTMARIGWKVLILVPPRLSPDGKWMKMPSTIIHHWDADDEWQRRDAEEKGAPVDGGPGGGTNGQASK